jgi:hypothetical protein
MYPSPLETNVLEICLREALPYPPRGTAILKRANIVVLLSCLYISAMIVGATHEYEASPTPTKLRNNTKSQNF